MAPNKKNRLKNKLKPWEKKLESLKAVVIISSANSKKFSLKNVSASETYGVTKYKLY